MFVLRHYTVVSLSIYVDFTLQSVQNDVNQPFFVTIHPVRTSQWRVTVVVSLSIPLMAGSTIGVVQDTTAEFITPV